MKDFSLESGGDGGLAEKLSTVILKGAAMAELFLITTHLFGQSPSFTVLKFNVRFSDSLAS
jgi:hypothetical protein